MMTQDEQAAKVRNLVWDIPVRLVHALLVGGFAAAFAIAQLSDDDGPLFALHMVFGLLVLVVALYRIVWGVVGTRYARFTAFEWRPAALAAYFAGVVTGGSSRHVGHNPATSYATIAILVFCLGIGGTGALMTLGVGEELEEVHEFFAFALLGVAIVHIAGVLLHTVRYRDDLIRSMLDGRKALASASDEPRPAWGAGVVLGVLALGTLGLGFAGYDPGSGSVVIPGVGWRLGEPNARESEPGQSTHEEEEKDKERDHHERGARHDRDRKKRHLDE